MSEKDKFIASYRYVTGSNSSTTIHHSTEVSDERARSIMALRVEIHRRFRECSAGLDDASHNLLSAKRTELSAAQEEFIRKWRSISPYSESFQHGIIDIVPKQVLSLMCFILTYALWYAAANPEEMFRNGNDTVHDLTKYFAIAFGSLGTLGSLILFKFGLVDPIKKYRSERALRESEDVSFYEDYLLELSSIYSSRNSLTKEEFDDALKVLNETIATKAELHRNGIRSESRRQALSAVDQLSHMNEQLKAMLDPFGDDELSSQLQALAAEEVEAEAEESAAEVVEEEL